MTPIPVHYETALVGSISVGEEGPSFAYDPGWPRVRGAFPMLLRIPLGSEAPPEVLVPWLMNLLPEGAPLVAIGRTLGTSPQDVVGLVQELGRDTAGALSIGHPRRGEVPGYRPVPDEAALERIIEELPARPFLVGEEGVSMSLAGAQEKLPVAFSGGGFAIPVGGAPSTHILKPDNNRLYGSVQNEALCMVLARRAGLDAAAVTTGVAGKRSYLLVTRYDRLLREGRWYRRHQDDFCQALGKPPGSKYERNQTGVRGPSLADFFALGRLHMGAASVVALLRGVILNVLLTNVDAHAKNYSILLSGREARLTPLYDLMCGAAWPTVTQNMSQSIGGQTRGRHIYARHWRRMAESCGLSAPAVLREVVALAGRVAGDVTHAADEVRSMPAGDHPMLEEFATIILKQCKLVAANARRDGPDSHSEDRLQEEAVTPKAAPDEAPPSLGRP